MRKFADRNDNAGHLETSDSRYGSVLAGLATHLDTPTCTYVDALGREIAVAEDCGAAPTQTLRVTTYEIRAGQFTGTSYDMTLEQDLAANYFVQFRGTVDSSTPAAPDCGVHVTQDPFGTGDLASSGASDRIRLERGSLTEGDWEGTVVVWECLGDTTASGFQLVDVKSVSMSGTAAGSEQTTSTSANTTWSDLDRVALYSGGSTCASGGADAHCSLSARLTPSGTATIDLARYGGSSVALEAATFTVYAVQWGEEHTIQRVLVAGSSGGDGIDDASEYVSTSIDAVERAHTWCSMTGWAAGNGIGDTVGASHKSADSPEIHVTRTVYDLADQVTEVWDARGLASATWAFAYDHAGRRISSNHTTALGQRYALADAAGNPIWTRDARGMEVDRVFDALNRPETEHSDDGSNVKLRRKWTYIDYISGHPDLSDWQSKNLCGRLEEERDADGLRFFEYDWRGLVTKTSHRFWSVEDGSARDWDDSTSDFWTQGDAWDPEVPATARGAISDWLELDNLTDTTTVEVATTYDAAGRPTEVEWPEGWKARSSYNEAGQLAGIEVDPGTSTYQDVLLDTIYNARGQVSGFTHGNGVETLFEHDNDIERLVRVFTQRVDATTTHFQDLEYVYDPAGNPVRITDALSTSTYRANQVVPNSRGFTYDPRYRLVRATGKKHATVVDRTTNVVVTSPDPNDYEPYTFRYGYDEVGNFTTNQEYRSGTQNLHYKAGRIDLFNGDVDEAGSYTDPASGNFTYDENGNTLHTPRIDALAYTFDDQVRYVDLLGGGEVRYLRHADQRVLRFVNKTGVMALGVYLGPWEYHQRQGTTAYTKTVLHVEGHGRHAQMEEVLAGSDPDSLAIFYHHSDHLRSGHVLTKSDGTLLSQEEYFPYGRASDRRDARNRYRFIGVERDEDTGLCMTGPRTYDPVSGRFLQGDAVAVERPGNSPFAYSANSPIGFQDRGGYQEAQVAETMGAKSAAPEIMPDQAFKSGTYLQSLKAPPAMLGIPAETGPSIGIDPGGVPHEAWSASQGRRDAERGSRGNHR